jgi:hypothetical protein
MLVGLLGLLELVGGWLAAGLGMDGGGERRSPRASPLASREPISR